MAAASSPPGEEVCVERSQQLLTDNGTRMDQFKIPVVRGDQFEFPGTEHNDEPLCVVVADDVNPNRIRIFISGKRVSHVRFE